MTQTERSIESGTPNPRQWRARDVGLVSFLFGFPAGLGLVAANVYRLHRPAAAAVILVSSVVLAAFVVVVVSAAPLAAGLNLVLAVVLYRLVRGDARQLDARGQVTASPRIAEGVATIVGGWLLALLPVIMLTFLGWQVMETRKGTVEFGTGGSACAVEGGRTTFDIGQPVHLVAIAARPLSAGEVVRASISGEPGSMSAGELTLSGPANCLSGALEHGLPLAGTYRITYAVGSEIIAQGQVTVVGSRGQPSAAP